MTLGGDRVADQCTKMDCPKKISQCTYILSGPVHAVTPPNKRRCAPVAVAGRTTPAFSLPTASINSLECAGQASWHSACLFWRRPFSSAVALNLQAYDYLHQGGANFFCKSQRINIDTLQVTI